MYFLGDTALPDRFLPPPDTRAWWERGRDFRAQFSELTAASYERQRLVENSNSEQRAMIEAYDARIAEVELVTGTRLENPYRAALADVNASRYAIYKDANPETNLGALERRFAERLKLLADERPDVADVIRAAVPVREDAFQLAQKAFTRAEAAERNATDVTGGTGFFASVGGSLAGMANDPLAVGTLFIGGPELGMAKTMFGRVMSRAATEAAVNGGIEAGLQVAANDWQRKAGVEPQPFWTQVGLAAAFGGGLGGLAQGIGEAWARKGLAAADAAPVLERVAAGQATPDDARFLADGLGVKLSDDELGDLARAAEADGDTAAVLSPAVRKADVEEQLRAMETGEPLPTVADELAQGRRPPGLKPVARAEEAAANPASALAEGPALHLRDDPRFQAFVREQETARLARIEDDIRAAEADLAYLREDGATLDGVPSERDFSGVKGATDDQRIARVMQELEGSVARGRAQLAEGARTADDPAYQVAYARQFGQQQIVQPELRTSKRAEPASAEAVEAAAAKLAAAGGEPARPLTQAAAKTEFVPRETLDIMDALPGGTDAAGNPVVTTHAEMSDFARRMDEMADLIASCKT